MSAKEYADKLINDFAKDETIVEKSTVRELLIIAFHQGVIEALLAENNKLTKKIEEESP